MLASEFTWALRRGDTGKPEQGEHVHTHPAMRNRRLTPGHACPAWCEDGVNN